MRLPGLSAGIGLVVGVLLLAVASLWFVGAAIQDSRQQAEVRKATIAAMGLADTIGRVQQGGADAAALAAAAEAYRQADPLIRDVRIVRQQGAQFIHSTDAADVAKGALPRRLVRDEKPLFDLTAELRANIETNTAERIKRLAEIQVAGLGDRLRVTAPVFVGDAYWGIVQLERERSGALTGADQGYILWLALAALAIFALAAFGIARALGDGRAARWAGFGIAALLLLGVSWLYAQAELTKVAAYERARGAELAVALNDARAGATAALAQVGTLPPREVAWDVDSFRRPLPGLLPDGTMDVPAIAAAVEARTDTVSEGLWGTVALSIAVLAFFALGAAQNLWNTLREHRSAYFYVAPALLGMLFLVFFPFSYGVILSFTDRTLFNQSVPLTELWVGFDNYVRILSDVDVLRSTPDGTVINYESFYWTLFITICWTVANVAIGVTLGLALALVLNVEGLRGKAVYRVLLILPWAIPNYITALTWKGMFHPQFGVINQAIVMFGGEPVAWFDSVFSSFMTGVITNGWLSFPFMMVVSLGALQSIPSDMYEAAELDGASKWQQFWNITLPLLKPALIPAIILSVVWTFNMFNVIYLVSGGAPAGANEILITKAYKIAFERYQYAYAAAYSFVIFLILLGYGYFQNRVSKATEQVR